MSPPPTSACPLSLHDALPIWTGRIGGNVFDIYRRAVTDVAPAVIAAEPHRDYGRSDIGDGADRKSTRLNSSHLGISYAVFCLKKKKKKKQKSTNKIQQKKQHR